MNNSFIEFFVIIGMGYFVYFFTRAFIWIHEEQRFSDARKSAIEAFKALFIGWAAISGLFLLFSLLGISGSNRQEFGLWHVIRQIMLACLFWGPALIVMRRRRESWSSAGITKRNIGKSTLLGIILSIFMLLYYAATKQVDTGEALRSLSLSDFWAFLTFLVVGISEEFGFRGYLQTRLIAWLGITWGLVMASILMAAGHVVQRMVIMGMPGIDAMVSSLSLIPISLLYGYIMLRTENVVAGTVLHAFIDWINVVCFP